MRYLGIDFGTKKIGIALSDEAGTMGFPRGIMPVTSTLPDDILTLIKEEGVGAVVMGESVAHNGKLNPVAKAAQEFAEKLRVAGITVHFEPEMFTTQAARRTPEGVMEDVHQAVDAQAAALILTSYLERHDNH